MLAKNVHGIDADEAPQIAVNINNKGTQVIVTDEESASLYADAIERDSEWKQ